MNVRDTMLRQVGESSIRYAHSAFPNLARRTHIGTLGLLLTKVRKILDTTVQVIALVDFAIQMELWRVN